MGSYSTHHPEERASNPTILLITTSEILKASLQKAFFGLNYSFLIARNEGTAIEFSSGCRPAIVLIDRQGQSWKTLRNHPSFKHIPMATIQSPQQTGCTEEECLRELDEGLDACLCDQSYRQIVAQVRSIFRRHENSSPGPTALHVGGLRMDIARHEVHVHARPVELTPREFQILKQFMESPGLVLSRQSLLNQVWGVDYALEEHALDVHIHSLRHKIEPKPSKPAFIVTIRGIGYKLQAS